MNIMTDVVCEVRLDDIKVGERSRKDMGDIKALADSIREVGLLHPIVISPDNTLIAGQRRLEAVKLLGWQEVPARVVRGLEEIDQALKAERDENRCRKEFNLVEVVAMGRRIATAERAAAKERQAMAGPTEGPGKKEGGKLPEAVKGDTRDKVAKAVGVSGRTYEKAKAVVEAAEKDPGKYQHLVEKMATTGKVDRAYRELRGPKPSAPASRRRGTKVNTKKLLGPVMKEAAYYGESPPRALKRMHAKKREEYAAKLTELARLLTLWAKAITPTAAVAEAVQPPCEVGAGVI
jgi:ParB-like chromosome segregation protein Spo0J